MDLQCKLIKKTFTTEDKQTREYYVLAFTLFDGTVVEQTIKSYKAQLLTVSQNLLNKDKKSSFLH